MRLSLVAALLGLTPLATVTAIQAAPQFGDFGVAGGYTGSHRMPILDTPKKWAYRTRLRAAAEGAPNFAGEFVVTTWGCGTGCTEFAIVSPRTGRVFMPSFGAAGGETMYSPTDDKWERVEWKANSRLLIVNGKVGTSNTEPDAHHFYAFDGHELNYLAKERGKPYLAPSAPVTVARAAPVTDSPTSPKVGTAAALPATFLGRWSSSYAECRNPSDGVMKIEPDRVDAHESRCGITKLEHAGNDWTAITDCEGEGEQWASRVRLTVQGDALIVQRDRDPPVPMVRCP